MTSVLDMAFVWPLLLAQLVRVSAIAQLQSNEGSGVGFA